MATLQRDSPYIHLLDLHWPSGETEAEPHTIKRHIAPVQIKLSPSTKMPILNGISWHPTDVERLLILMGNGSISDFKIQQRVAISWDPYNNVCASVGVNLNQINAISPPSTPSEIASPWEGVQAPIEVQSSEDIADVIHRRALMDYGKLVFLKYEYNQKWLN